LKKDILRDVFELSHFRGANPLLTSTAASSNFLVFSEGKLDKTSSIESGGSLRLVTFVPRRPAVNFS
jgi:hypothetical protein